MRHPYALYPGHFFLETKRGADGSWCGFSHDNDLEVMKTRFVYQVEMARPGDSIRLLDHKKTILDEKTI